MHAEWKAPLATVAALVVTAGVALTVWLVWFSGPSTEDIEKWAERDVASYMLTDPKLSKYSLDVVGVTLLHSDGNKYEGLVTVETRSGEAHKVPITVTYDDERDQGMWQIERGGMLFLIDEPNPSSSP